jgi:hypothetical protein
MKVLTLAFVAAVSILMIESGRAQSAKPERQWEVNVRFAPAPPTAAGLVSEAHAVAHVKVASHRSEITGAESSKFPTIETLYESTIVDIIKDNASLPKPGAPLAFSTAGGTVETPQQVLKAHSTDFAALQDGHDYVVFLQAMGGDHQLAAWTLVRGADSIYDLSNTLVATMAPSAIGVSQNGRRGADFVAELKAAARK